MQDTIAVCRSCGAKNRIPAVKQHLHPKCGKCGTSLDMRAAAVPVDLEDSFFADFINKATLPMMVDFFSPTCGPCQMLVPVVANLAKTFAGRAIIAKLDTSRNPAVASRYRIRGVPTLIFFRNGQIVEQITGAVPESSLAATLQRFL